MELLKVIGLVIGIIGSGYAIFKSIVHGKALSLLTTNHIEHIKADIEELKTESRKHDEKLENKFDKLSGDIAKLYTKIGAIETACRINHGGK